MQQRDPIGLLVGIIVFLGGVGLLLLTFKQASELFLAPPSQALGLKEGAAIDMNSAGQSVVTLVFRVSMLLLMCIVGSVISNRGIRLYQAAIGEPGKKKDRKGTGPASEPAESTEP